MDEGRELDDEGQVDQDGEEANAMLGATIRLYLRLTNDAFLVHTLTNNSRLTAVSIDLELVLEDHLQAESLTFIAAKSNLHTISLVDDSALAPVFHLQAQHDNAVQSFCHRMLAALAVSNTLKVLSLVKVAIVADDLANLLRRRQSKISTLDLQACKILGNTRALQTAIESNDTVRTLHLRAGNNDHSMMPFLTGLKSNVTVQELTISMVGCVEEPTFQAALELMENTKARKLFFSGAMRILRGTVSNEAITDIRIVGFDLNAQSQVSSFKQLLLQKKNLRWLSMSEFVPNDADSGIMFRALYEAFTPSNSQLLCIDFSQSLIQQVFPGPIFEDFLKAAASSSLKCLKLGCFEYHHRFQALVRAIPWLKLKELSFSAIFTFGRQLEIHEWFRDLLKAVMNNYTLLKLGCRLLSGGADNERRRELQIYLDRNKDLRKWAANPDTVPREILPDVIMLAAKAGEHSLLGALLVPLLDEECLNRMSMFQVSDDFVSHCTAALFEGNKTFCLRVLDAYQQFMELRTHFRNTVGSDLLPPAAVKRMWEEHKTFSGGTEYKRAFFLFDGDDIRNQADASNLSQSIRAEYSEITQTLGKARFGDSLDTQIWLDYHGCGFSNKRRKID